MGNHPHWAPRRVVRPQCWALFLMNQKVDQLGATSDADSSIWFLDADGAETWGTLRHLGRHEVSFELVSTDGVLRTSEILDEFRVKLGHRLVYSGRATTTAVTHVGPRMMCSVTLEEPLAEPAPQDVDPSLGGGAFDGFISGWQKYYHIDPGFKVVVADLQLLLSDMEIWLAGVEVGFGERMGRGHDLALNTLARELGTRTTPALNSMFEKFEVAAAAGSSEWRPAYRSFSRRQLNALLLCAPFLHRTYRKPLGYAGDYEMVNMICRDPLEGSTLFARLVNLWFLEQPPAVAHRNRLLYLEKRIADVTVRAVSEGRTARILSIGCGPAVEVQQFLRRHSYADRAEFTLLDFNEETLSRARAQLSEIKKHHQRLTPIGLVKKSVMALLREPSLSFGGKEPGFDMVYCAGLFDYLTDPVCRRLSTQLFRWVRPGGIFLSTNVHTSNPWPFVMDFVMDWHLIYRTTAQMVATRPEQTAPEDCQLKTDITGVNVYLEVKKAEMAARGIK